MVSLVGQRLLNPVENDVLPRVLRCRVHQDQGFLRIAVGLADNLPSIFTSHIIAVNSYKALPLASAAVGEDSDDRNGYLVGLRDQLSDIFASIPLQNNAIHAGSNRDLQKLLLRVVHSEIFSYPLQVNAPCAPVKPGLIKDFLPENIVPGGYDKGVVTAAFLKRLLFRRHRSICEVPDIGQYARCCGEKEEYHNNQKEKWSPAL